MIMKDKNYSYTKAVTSDGTIQINVTVKNSEVVKSSDKALKEFSEVLEIPGFRKGKAPLSKVKESVDETKLVRKVIEDIIPKIYSEIVTEEKIKPIVAPRIELISVEDEKDWQLRLLTCEMPEVELGDYKKAISGEFASKAIWTPGKDKKKTEKELTHDEKEIIVKDVLIKTSRVTIPKMLINDEVESRLSQLLERLEKLGIDLESYLASIGKNPVNLREEYEKQSSESLSVDLILNKISDEEKTDISDAELESAIKSYATDEKTMATLEKPEQKTLIKSVLRRRKTLENLIHST